MNSTTHIEMTTNQQNINKNMGSQKDVTSSRDFSKRPGEVVFLLKKVKQLKKTNNDLASELEALRNELTAAYFEMNRLKSESQSHVETLLKSNIEDASKSLRKLKILVLGATQIKPKDIYGIAKNFGLSKENLDLQLDYEKNKRFNLEKLYLGTEYSAVMLGPIAHKVVGMGDHESLLHAMKEEGFPPHCGIWNTVGELKITKTSLRAAFECMLNKLGSFEADVHKSAESK